MFNGLQKSIVLQTKDANATQKDCTIEKHDRQERDQSHKAITHIVYNCFKHEVLVY